MEKKFTLILLKVSNLVVKKKPEINGQIDCVFDIKQKFKIFFSIYLKLKYCISREI